MSSAVATNQVNREPARLPFWHEKQLLADAKRDDRRAAVLNRLARAGRRQMAINRLAGVGSPGAGSLLEEARKKGEQRHTDTVMAARKLRDTDGEALVVDFARVEEERHEAVAALKLQQKVHAIAQDRLQTERDNLCLQHATEKRRREVMETDARRLRDRLLREQARHAIAMERALAKHDAKQQAQTATLRAELAALEDRLETEVPSLRHEIRALRTLTEFMITGRKRAQKDVEESEAEKAAARARS